LVAFYQGFDLRSVLWRCVVNHLSGVHDVGHEVHVLYLIGLVGLEAILLEDIFRAWEGMEETLIGFIEAGREGVGEILVSL
jgi:hypothetical protein